MNETFTIEETITEKIPTELVITEESVIENPKTEEVDIDLKKGKFKFTNPGQRTTNLVIIILTAVIIVIALLALILKQWALPIFGGSAILGFGGSKIASIITLWRRGGT